ncbi:MAG: hypothetical protein GY863_01565 [bacterium]|nr:hypothetical protein [bacterium]
MANKKDSLKRLPDDILTLARENNIKLEDDPELLGIIQKARKGKEIPLDAFKLISEFILHFYKLKNEWNEN